MKRYLSFFLILALLLCGCGNASEAPETTAAPTETVPPTTEAMDYEDYYQLGLELAQDWESLEEAIEAFDAAIALDATHPEAYVARGNATKRTRSQENYAAATQDFEAALALDELCPGAYLGLADLQVRAEDFDAAIAILKEAAEKTQDADILEELERMESGDIRDSDGRTYFKTGYDEKDGRRIWYHVYHYFPDGLGYSVTAYNDYGKQIDYAEALKDEKGRQIQNISIMLNDGTLSEIKQVFDENDNCIRRESYDAQGNLKSYSLLSYDENGNQILLEGYNRNGVMTMYTTHEYDENGNKTKVTQYDPNGTMTAYFIYTYNAAGYQTESRNYDRNDVLTSRTVTEYDEDNRQISSTWYNAKGEVTSYTDYTK